MWGFTMISEINNMHGKPVRSKLPCDSQPIVRHAKEPMENNKRLATTNDAGI